MAQEQNLKNHARLDPMFHGFLFFGGLFLLGAAIYAVVQRPEPWGYVRIFGVLWLLVLMFKIRLYSLKVQDRVIRLEERVRMMQLLPEATRSRIDELTPPQYVALRFASDGEVPGLVQKTLDGNWNQKQIKQAIQIWRADFFRV